MFDLEKEIKVWKKGFGKYDSFEDGLIADMELHLREAYETMKAEGLNNEAAFAKAVAQVGTAESIAAEYGKNRELALDRRRPWRPARFLPGLVWNEFKVTCRLLRRQALFSLINISGLAISLAAVILIMLWVLHETGFDRFHKGHETIYRIVKEVNRPEESYLAGSTPGRFAQAMLDQLPGIQAAARLRLQPRQIIEVGDKTQYEDGGAFADPSFLSMFSFPLLEGDRRHSLASPDAMIVCQSFARKYFGSRGAIGKTVGYMGRLFRITGIFKDLPDNSSLRFRYLCSLQLLETDPVIPVDWYSDYFLTFVQVHDPAQVSDLQDQLQRIILKHAPLFAKFNSTFRFQALREMHLEENFRDEDIVTGNRSAVKIFSFAAFLILLIAVVNFINLSMARATTRTKEVGIRKILGASRKQMILQFLGESFALTALAGSLALLLVLLILPAFNQFFALSLRLDFKQGGLAKDLGLVMLLTALAAGVYPAFIMSSFRVRGMLNQMFTPGTKSAAWRTTLVVLQFTISLFLLIGTGVLQRQLRFMLDHKLGFDKQNIAVMEAREMTGERYLTLKDRLLQQPGIQAVTAAAGLLTERSDGGPVKFQGLADDGNPNFEIINVDADFIAFMGMKMESGRGFSGDRPADVKETLLLNQTGARILGGVQNILGKQIQLSNGRPRTIIGVVNDSHLKSLHAVIEPLAIRPLANPLAINSRGIIMVKMDGASLPGTLDALQGVWRTVVPELPFDYHFLDGDYTRLYKSEIQAGSLSKLLSLLSIFISCFGLFGLAAFTARQRTREIGIRKVMGASLVDIFWTLTRKFGLLILWAIVIALPISYYWLSQWLAKYPYRINLELNVFLFSSLGIITVAMLAVSSGTIRAARSNPIDSLRYE